ncbi:hypothetical protein C8Q75DRAFT_737517 [Abortiporus biennis]|nr:hypothetical protein C8Q75DRAFT_737517 [Abortiporus biennis]
MNTAVTTSQDVTLPLIPELFNPEYMNILLPISQTSNVPKLSAKEHDLKNPMMDALEEYANRSLTGNGAPALASTESPVLDLFNILRPWSSVEEIYRCLTKAWHEDPQLTLRIIWNVRSIHDGKGDKTIFYHAWGWLYKYHPRTAIENLHNLVDPVCKLGKSEKYAPHGYWKDLLNILCLAALDQFNPSYEEFPFLSPAKQYPFWLEDPPSSRSSHPTRRSKRDGVHHRHQRSTYTPEERQHRIEDARKAQLASVLQARIDKAHELHDALEAKLKRPEFRALYITVARLFAEKLIEDSKTLDKIDSLPAGDEKRDLYRQLTLTAKWAPTPGKTHDRHSNISTAISLLLLHSQEVGAPSSLSFSFDRSLTSGEAYMARSYYRRWVLTPLRAATQLPEPLMSANRWNEIKYNRVASVCMKMNMKHFFLHDEERFVKYLEDVESGKKKISGATLMPHEIVTEVVQLDMGDTEVERKVGKIKARGMEAQWKTLVNRIGESGALEGTLAVCDVSGSMGSLSYSSTERGSTGRLKMKDVQPIQPAVALSLLVAQLAKPPFSNGFITFSEKPEFVRLDPTMTLSEQIQTMTTSSWGMNTDFEAVFLRLLLPLATSNKVKPEDMVKRLFVFSDMQFDESLEDSESEPGKDWSTSYDTIEKAYQELGYEVPQLVFWNLAQGGPTTNQVTSERKGVAMMNGFSAAMLKVFLGEEDEEMKLDGEENWEEVKKDGETVEVKAEEFNPLNIMKKAVMKKSFDGLVVVD